VKDVRLDSSGRQRCWNCGGFNFTQQRTTRSKVAFGLSAALSKAKLRCVRCGEYNDVGSATPYTGPASRKYAAEWKAEQAAPSASTRPAPAPSVTFPQAPSTPSPPSPVVPAPTAPHALRPPRNCRAGHENPGTANFCLTCGLALNDAGTWCAAGHLSPAGTHFCGSCGCPTEPITLAEWDPDADNRSVNDHEGGLAEAKERVWTLRETPDIETGLKTHVLWIARIFEAREGLALARARKSAAQGAGDESATNQATADEEAFAIDLEWAQYMHDGYEDVWHLGKDDPGFAARQKDLIARQESELKPRLFAARLDAARLGGDPSRIRVAELELQVHQGRRNLGRRPMGTDLAAVREQVDHDRKSLAQCRLDYALAVAQLEGGYPHPEALQLRIASQEKLVASSEGLLKSTEGLLVTLEKSPMHR
jgi:hypothetical protein